MKTKQDVEGWAHHRFGTRARMTGHKTEVLQEKIIRKQSFKLLQTFTYSNIPQKTTVI